MGEKKGKARKVKEKPKKGIEEKVEEGPREIEKSEGIIMGGLHFLEDMDKRKEREASGFGEMGNPFGMPDTKIKYGFSVKLEPELKDFPRHSRQGIHRRPGFGGFKGVRWKKKKR